MKRYVILSVMMMFLAVSLLVTPTVAYGQDCGKCPFKAKCMKEKAAKHEVTDETPVIIVEKEKIFHKKDCKLVSDLKNPTLLKLGVAKKSGYKPCPVCFPVDKKLEKPTEKPVKKEEKKEDEK